MTLLQEDPEITSSNGHSKSTATYRTLPSEKHMKARLTASPQQRTKDYIETDGRVERRSHRKPHPGTATQKLEVFHKSGAPPGRVRGGWSTSGTPNSGICTRDMNLQNIWLRKPMGLISKESKVLQETEIPLLKAWHVISYALRPPKKTADHDCNPTGL